MSGAVRILVGLMAALLAGSCASMGHHTYPSNSPLYRELKSFKAPPLEQVDGASYRLVWHAAYRMPAAILVNCASECRLEVRFTNGLGTYWQGKFYGVLRRKISAAEFNAVASGFVKGKFGELDPNIDGKSRLSDVICSHSGHYFLESYVDGTYKMIYRYCQDSYFDDLEIAFPLIELAEKYFPGRMQAITAGWIVEERKQK